MRTTFIQEMESFETLRCGLIPARKAGACLMVTEAMLGSYAPNGFDHDIQLAASYRSRREFQSPDCGVGWILVHRRTMILS